MRRSAVVMSPARSLHRAPSVGDCIDFVRDEVILPESRTPMELHDYQIDLFEQWHADDVVAHLTVIAAGNAKSTTLAAYLVARLFLGEEESIPVVAETLLQAWLTAAGKAKRMIELNPSLSCRAEILEGQGSRRGIYVPGTAGHLFPIASKPSGLQGLTPSLAVLEETSEATMETFGALTNRCGKRAGAKVVGISTPSFTPNNALLTIQNRARSGDPMPGVALTEYISDQTDHRDEAGWHQANPGLRYGLPDIGAIRTDLALLPEQWFRAYRLCQNPKGAQSCWLNAVDDEGNEAGDAFDVWQRGESGYTLREDTATWVGVDVAKSRDHAAVVWGQFRDDGRLHAKCKVWTPTADADIDLEDIADHLHMLAGRFDLRAVWHDPSYFYNAPQLERDGLPMVAVPPTEARMAPLVGHAFQSLRRARVTHDSDDQFTRHVLAARRRYCARGFTLEKITFGEKIDAAVALVLMHGAAHDLGDPEPEVGAHSFRFGG